MQASLTRLGFHALAVVLLLLFVSPTISYSFVQELPKGTVVENVPGKTDATQGYALYLPSAYTPERKWPIIYAFDPGKRGIVPVQIYKEAAERYGYIVAGSNNSRNGANIDFNKVLSTLWNDTHERFNIDEGRVYATGFSGGGRVACAFGYMYEGQVAGVITSGAGFPNQITPSRQTPFILYGTIGTEDFNYFELRRLDATLDALGISHHIEIFDGGHEWPSPPLATAAVEWMQLQAIRRGRLKATREQLEQLFSKRLQHARALDVAGDIIRTHAAYESLATDFEGLRDVSEVAAKAAQLKSSKELKDALRKERDIETQERKAKEELYAITARLGEPAERVQVFGELRGVAGGWRRRAKEQKDSAERRMARRVLYDSYAAAIQEALDFFARKKYDAAALQFEVAAEMMPEDAGIQFGLARVHALQGKKKRALEALKKSVQNGWTDASLIERHDDFETLRNEADFKRLVEELRNRPQAAP